LVIYCPLNPVPLCLSPREEIKDIAELRAVGPVDFGVAAAVADDGGEPFVLHVKQFGQHAAGRPKLVDLVIVVAAFDALSVGVVHLSCLLVGIYSPNCGGYWQNSESPELIVKSPGPERVALDSGPSALRRFSLLSLGADAEYNRKLVAFQSAHQDYQFWGARDLGGEQGSTG
jgi:hypothetical protein